jgi:hypothetical protein
MAGKTFPSHPFLVHCYGAYLEGVYESNTPAPFSIQLIRVPYDIEQAIRQAEEIQMPDLQPYVNELRTARYRGSVRPAQD